MKRIIGFVAAAALLVLPATASAQAQRGDNEVLAFGLVNSFLTSETTSTSGTIVFNLGRFVTNRTQIGGGPTVTVSAMTTPTQQQLVGFDRSGQPQFRTVPGETTVNATIGANAFLRQYFGSGRVHPYVGGEMQISDLEAAGDSTYFAGLLGVKNYLSEKAALDLKGSLGFLGKDPGAFQLLQFSIGITYLF